MTFLSIDDGQITGMGVVDMAMWPMSRLGRGFLIILVLLAAGLSRRERFRLPPAIVAGVHGAAVSDVILLGQVLRRLLSWGGSCC